MISVLLALGVAVIGAIGLFAAGTRRRGRQFVMIPPSAATQSDRPYRQAIYHFASGVLPPWR